MCVSVGSPLVVCIPFSIRFMLCQIWITYMNFMIFEEYLWELERGQTDRQTDRQTECINTFQLCWKVLKKTDTIKYLVIIFFFPFFYKKPSKRDQLTIISSFALITDVLAYVGKDVRHFMHSYSNNWQFGLQIVSDWVGHS